MTITTAQYQTWLNSSAAIPVVLVEAYANSGGVEVVRYLSTAPFNTQATDTPSNQIYLPRLTGGLSFTEQIVLDNSAGMSAGTIEVENSDGAVDSWLLDVWENRQITAYIGDASWPRSSFQVIFQGIMVNFSSTTRDKPVFNLADNSQLLNTPISSTLLGGTTTNATQLMPLSFGECHNITPLLTNPATLEYAVHIGPVANIFEVRDNGIPVTVVTSNSTGRFTLTAPPAGAITASVQGDAPYDLSTVTQLNLLDWQPQTVLTSATRTNLILQSQNFTATWGQNGCFSSVTANAAAAPDGTTTASQLVTNTSATGNWATLTQGIVVGAGGNVGKTYTVSVWLWCLSGTISADLVISDFSYHTSYVPILITTTPTRFTFSSAGTTGGWSASGTGIGMGIDVPVSVTFLAWGAQLEVGTAATRYIKTTTAAVAYQDYVPDWQYAVPQSPAPRTNLLQDSQAFSASVWLRSQCVSTDNSGTSPDGTSSASLCTLAAAVTNSYVYQQNNALALQGETLTFSVWLKAGTLSANVELYLRDSGYTTNFGDAVFNLASGVITSLQAGAAAIAAYPNGWYRCSITGTFSSTVANGFGVFIDPVDGAANDNQTYWSFGAQLENSATATRYIPTVASPVTVIDPMVAYFNLSSAPATGVPLTWNGTYTDPTSNTVTAITNQQMGLGNGVQTSFPLAQTSHYSNKITGLVKRIVTGFGTNPFTSTNLDLANLSAFDAAHQQPVGIFVSGTTNVLDACAQLAVSVGAQVVIARTGLLQLQQVVLPAAGTPTVIQPYQMVEQTLMPYARSVVVAAVVLGFCQNYTVQNALVTNLPADAINLFSTQWIVAQAVDVPTQVKFKLTAMPAQIDTCLLVMADATAEAARELALWKTAHITYQFEGTRSLMTLVLGQPITLFNPRFSMSAGVTGLVVALSPDWTTGRVIVQVLI